MGSTLAACGGGAHPCAQGGGFIPSGSASADGELERVDNHRGAERQAAKVAPFAAGPTLMSEKAPRAPFCKVRVMGGRPDLHGLTPKLLSGFAAHPVPIAARRMAGRPDKIGHAYPSPSKRAHRSDRGG